MAMKLRIWRNQSVMWHPNVWDFFAIILVFFLLALLASNAAQMTTPYQLGESIPISLSINHLPGYALRTVLRIFLALIAGIIIKLV